MKKALVYMLSVSLVFLSLTACGKKDSNTAMDTDNGSDSVLSEITVASDIDIGGMDLEFTDNDKTDTYSDNEIKAVSSDDDTVNITADGVYKITGKHTQIVVDASDTAKPHIILENADISSNNGPAIYIKQADKVFITVTEGTSSTLSDGSSYDTSYDNADGAIFSKADLTINGKGSLTVTGNYKCGIVSKDDLNICDTTLKVESVGSAIEGKDCVKITGADITTNAGTDGIKSTNTEDGTRGYVLIDSGSFDLTAQNDGIQAETALFINGGDFNITTGGGANVSSSDYGSDGNRWGMWGGYATESSTDTESAKALKATSLIKITSGKFEINSSDDSIHSNSDLEITGGSFNIASGDDGIHADDQLIISDGTIKITKSYEGIEATAITVSGGSIDVTASDDGFNAAGGNDSSALGGRPGQNPFESDSDAQINFTGGYILVNASGDGIDSNGNLTLSGGVLLVSGPTNSGNGSLDYGGTATVNGGVAVIVGSSGMATTFASSSSQPSFMYTIDSSASSGTSVSLSDGDKVIASFLPAKSYNNVIITCPSMELGKTYTLNIGGAVSNCDINGYTDNGKISNAEDSYEIELSSISVSNGGGMNGGMGDHGGMQRPGRRW